MSTLPPFHGKPGDPLYDRGFADYMDGAVPAFFTGEAQSDRYFAGWNAADDAKRANPKPEVRLVKATRSERRRPEWVPGRVIGSGYRTRGYMSETQKSYRKKPRLYVDVEGEGFWEAFGNRTTRPHNAYRAVLGDALEAVGLPRDTKARWNPNAGCSMCPCSPGFVLDYTRKPGEQPFDVDVTVTSDTSGDRAALKSNDPDVAAGRLVQIAADPTMPADARTAALYTAEQG